MKRNTLNQGATILVVEDDEGVRNLLDCFLSLEGHTTVQAPDAAEALTLVACLAPDLVLLDLVLPDLHGLEVLDRLKKIHPDVPVIIITGYGTQEMVRQAMESGAFHFLTKPFVQHQLCTAVAQALEFRRVFGHPLVRQPVSRLYSCGWVFN